jgi:hypothetical protein
MPTKITRTHDRQKKGKKIDPKGERFHLQGQRWRFPKNLALAEVETRIGRIKSLWNDLERFCQSAVFLNLDAAATACEHEFRLRNAITFVLSGSINTTKIDLLTTPLPGTNPLNFEPGYEPSLPFLERQIQKDGICRIEHHDAWSPLGCWIAEQLRMGIQPVLLPDWDPLINSVCLNGKIEYRFRCLAEIIRKHDFDRPARTDQLDSKDALALLRALLRVFPSVPWAMHDHQIDEVVRLHEAQNRESIKLIREIKPANPSAEPPASTIAELGKTFHEAVKAYKKKREGDFTTRGVFDGSGHHMIGLVDNFLKRLPDVELSRLDFAECQKMYDFWRERPMNTRSGKSLSAKHCTGHMGELDRFFKWLHKTTEFDWRRPNDFDLIDRKVKRLDTDRRSIKAIEIQTFQVDHLRLLYLHASPVQRLKLLWCLNCSHGAAEMGRVEWRDLFLDQPHPWIKEGLHFESNASDSWCGLLRPKTDVIAWWRLWPETVQLVRWWRGELQAKLARKLQPEERILLTSSGQPMYRFAQARQENRRQGCIAQIALWNTA